MDSTGLTTVSQSLISYLPLGLPMGIGALFAWVIWRTESWHLLRRRIWQITHGRGEITEPGIRDFVDEQTNLAAFRIFVGPSVTSLKQARELMEWSKVRHVDLGAIRMCGEFFDVQSRRIQRSDRFLSWSRYGWGISAMLLLGLGMLSFQLIASSQALLSLKSSGRDFLATESMVRSTWPPFYGPTLSSKDCERQPEATARLRFSAEDVATICGLLGQSGYKEFVNKALRSQRMGLFVLGLVFLVGMYFLALASLRSACALKLRRRGVDPALPAVQMELDFGRSA